MSQTRSELQLVGLVKAFLARPNGTATAEELLAWEDFYHIHDPMIRTRIRRIHKAWNVIDDLTQMVWKVLTTERLRKFRLGPDLGSVAGFVVKIANDMARKHAPRRPKVGSLSPEIANELPDPSLGPDIENEWMQYEEELRLLLERVRASLTTRDHFIAVLYFFENCSVAQIARESKLTEDCVSSVIHRVVLKLQELLLRRGSMLS